MQAQTIGARIVLTILALVFALIVAVAMPLTASAADEPDEYAECQTRGYDTYLECIEAIMGNSGERGPAAIARPAIFPSTLDDFLFLDLNMWGADFDFAPPSAPYFPSPMHDSIIDSRVTSY